MPESPLIPIHAADALARAVSVIQAGGLVAFPTDTVYGLAADLRNPQAIDRIYQTKGRDTTKAIAVLVGSVEQLSLVTADLPPAAVRLASRFWPGALTLVVPKRTNLPDNLSQTPTVGVRMPDHAFAREFLTTIGPLAVTSANLSGQADALTAADVLAQLGGRVDLILDGGRCPGGVPSTVVDCTSAEIRILRAGAIPAEEILRTL